MAWFLLARALFVAAVTYAAVLAGPFSSSALVNLLIGAGLGVLVVWVETRLRDAEVTDLLGALIGGAIAQAVGSEGLGDFSWRALLIAFLGASLLLLVLQAIGGRRGSSGRRG